MKLYPWKKLRAQSCSVGSSSKEGKSWSEKFDFIHAALQKASVCTAFDVFGSWGF